MSYESYDLRYISLGAGVQSTTIYLLAARGEIGPRPDVAIFADTQSEPPWVYDNLTRLEGSGTIPIVRATAGNLEESVRSSMRTSGHRFAAVPFWVKNEDGSRGMGARQCTSEYKIQVVKRAARELLGLEKGERAAGRFRVEEWIGISTDEAHRAKPSRTSWITTRWPLLFDKPMGRGACLNYLDSIGYPRPEKSACIFCPYRRDAEWLEWKRNHPELFEHACQIDDLIRSGGTLQGRGQQFISDSLVPLRDLQPHPDQGKQPDLFGNECEGMCGV